jgi:hypothetical protein
MDLVLVELDKGDDPAALLEQLKSADDFRKLARERLPGDEETTQPPTYRVVRGREDPMLGDVTPLFELSENEWTKQPYGHGNKKYLALVQSKTEARTPPFSEVRARVQNEYTTRKQRELTEELFRDLMARYKVKIVPPQAPASEPEEPKEKKE